MAELTDNNQGVAATSDRLTFGQAGTLSWGRPGMRMIDEDLEDDDLFDDEEDDDDEFEDEEDADDDLFDDDEDLDEDEEEFEDEELD